MTQFFLLVLVAKSFNSAQPVSLDLDGIESDTVMSNKLWKVSVALPQLVKIHLHVAITRVKAVLAEVTETVAVPELVRFASFRFQD